MSATIIEIALVILVLIGIVKEEKLIAWEDKVLDKVAEAIAKVIVARRRKVLEKAIEFTCITHNHPESIVQPTFLAILPYRVHTSHYI